jgi:hypothetical protein
MKQNRKGILDQDLEMSFVDKQFLKPSKIQRKTKVEEKAVVSATQMIWFSNDVNLAHSRVMRLCCGITREL